MAYLFVLPDVVCALPSTVLVFIILCKLNQYDYHWTEWIKTALTVAKTGLNNFDVITDIAALMVAYRYKLWADEHGDQELKMTMTSLFQIMFIFMQLSLALRYLSILKVWFNRFVFCCCHRFWLRKLTNSNLRLDLQDLKRDIEENASFLAETDQLKREQMRVKY